MGRGNEHRDRRRGFGDQPADPWASEQIRHPFEQRPPRPRRPEAGSGVETEARVKWFNAEKGFGFVELTDGSGEAFLHVRPVEAAGHSSLDPGTTLRVRVGQGQKGAQVTEVLAVDASTAEPARPRDPSRGPSRGPARERPFERDSGPSEERDGQVKWFNAEKGFGFVAVDGGKDVFVHRSVLMRAGLSDLQEGERVRMRVVQGHKGPEATSIAVLR